jgi:fibro-slime domain-containing protein
MRFNSVLTGGSVLTAVTVAGFLLAPAPKSAASDPPASVGLTGTIRDFRPDANHPDFSLSGSAGQGPICMNVAMTLDAANKPVYAGPGRRISQHWREGVASIPALEPGANRQVSWCHYNATSDGAGNAGKWQGGTDNGGITSGQSFAQWFRDVPGINLSRLWTINLTFGNDAAFGQCYMYDTNNFNPVDNQLMGNDFDEHNFFFTYEITARFTYDHDGNQFFWYKGDDDCWIFVNGRLVMDHGGIAGSREQTVQIHNSRPGLETMVDGQEYELRWFVAERKQPQSQFHIKTNLLLNTTESSDAVLAAYD